MKGLYILTNSILKHLDVIKIGMSMRLNERLFDYDSVFTNNKYIYCYVTDLDKLQILYIEKLILSETEQHRNFQFSSEYRNINNSYTIFYYHNLIINILEMFKINYEILIEPKFNKPTYVYEKENLSKIEEIQQLNINPFNISKRIEIQNKYLQKIICELDNNSKILVIAPTGFGKTKICYDLINEKANLKTILFFTPRKILNVQSSNYKYTSKLIKKYNFIIFDNSDKSNKIINDCLNHDKRIIIYSCYQSANNIYEIITNKEIDLIIFDEAHFIQSWIINNDEYIKYILTSQNINNRLFLTATPTENMTDNSIFGKCINLVKIYELINYGILCNIETIIKNMNHGKKEYYDLYFLISSSMTKYNKKKGIIYANTQENAKQLYKLFNNKQDNKIKAYIYISEFVELYNKNDNDLSDFENNINQCVIITCRKIDYGYDNIWIDFICFADPKTSRIDIRQIVGRGLRNNENIYPNKILHIFLPIYQNETDKINNYSHIIEYLKYIIDEVGQDIIINNMNHGFQLSGNKKLIKNYDGDNILPEICYILLTMSYQKYENFMRFLKYNNIYDDVTYNKLKETNEW